MKLKMIFALLLVAVVGLGGTACRHVASPATAKPIYYTCPMHPSVKVAQPGNCPVCNMQLLPAFAETDSGSAAPCGAVNCAAPGKNSSAKSGL